jgi:hypothetical protein
MRPGEIFLAIRGSGEMADTQVLGTCVFGRVGSSPTSRTSKLVLLSLFLGLLPVISLVVAPPANAATVTASGPHASPSVCNQTVGNATNVVAYRLAGGDCVVEFKNAGATTTWTVPDSASSVQYLIVGGGASGTRGICGVYWGQGGGGGEVLTGNRNVTPGVSETIVVGSGGARSGACPALGNRGETSTFSTLTARPGQPGNNIQANNAGRFGGTSGNGNAGGEGTANGSSCSGGDCGTGGGGGAGGAGGLGNSRNGGAGLSSSITGSALGYGGGGAGSNGTRGTASDGGSTGGDAAANRGGGGADGHGSGDFGGAGGSGIVIVRYTPDATAPSTSVSIATSYINSGTSVSTVLTTNETLSSVTLYYSTSSNLASPQSCGTTSNPINGQSLTCTIASSDGTYFIYSRGTDSAGNVEAAPVTADDSIIRDTVAPTRLSATLLASGNQIQLLYSETLTASPLPNDFRFSVSDSGTARSVTTVSVSGSTLTLTLSATIATARFVTLSYDSVVVTPVNLIEDEASNLALAFTGISVTNNSAVLNTLNIPTTLALASRDTSTATLSFTSTTNSSSHTLRLYDSATATLLSTTTSFTSGSSLTSLTPATAYYATLQAVGDGITYESSTASLPLYFTTLIRPPTIAASPQETATTVTRSARFAVSATSADAGTLSYQWQVSTNSGASFSNLSGVNISGATTATLTLSSLTLAENGYQYRVVITATKNGVSSSETSTAVVLTVNGAISLSGGSAISTTYGVAANSAPLSASGGTGSITYSIAPSTSGITINTATGVVSTTSSAARVSTNLTITATDAVGASATQSISVTIATGTSTISLSLSATPRKGGAITLTAITSSTGTAAFRAKGRVITGCANRSVNAGTLTATCTWKPISHGAQKVSASYTSNDADWGNAATSVETVVLKRVSR